jgi:hypothetical protein
MTKTLCGAALLVALSAVGGSTVTTAQNAEKLRITGWALSMGTIGTGKNQTIQIDINNWSTPATRDRLISVFMEKKQDGLLKELQKLPEIGRWNFPGYVGPDPNNIYRLGTPLRYAMNHPGADGSRRIVILTDRVIGFQEARNQPRSIDYPFTLMELRFDASGKGEGRMASHTMISWDKKKNQIELENYSSEPIRLNELKLEVKK